MFFLLGFLSPSSFAKKPFKCEGNCVSRQDDGIVFYADRVFYDQILKIWRFSGRVSVHGEKQYLYAQEVIFHEETSLMIAKGDVRFKEHNQECLTADYVEITGYFKKVLLKSIRFATEDKSRFAGNRAELNQEDDLLVIENGVYSACEPCWDGKKSPFWQVKSKRIEKRQKKRRDTLYRCPI